MRLFITVLLICSVSYAGDLSIRIIPDTIYVGTLTTVSLSVMNLNKGEYPEFSNIVDQPEIYNIVERVLNEHSADYILQFWVPGLTIIPSISLYIKKNKKDIIKLESGNINISVLSSINTSNSTLRNIKPMQKINIANPYEIFLFTILFLLGALSALYLWKYHKINDYKQYNKSAYTKSIFQETLHSLQALQLPRNINKHTTEEYYLTLSHICRAFIKEEYFIRATEMTSEELEIYFLSIGMKNELIDAWSKANKIADIVKYAGKIPSIDQFNKDKEDFIDIIKSFHGIESRIII